MYDPKPPEDVRLIDPNGEVWPCSVAFSHTDDRGMHYWIATPVGLCLEDVKKMPRTGKHGWQFKMALLPARTQIKINFPGKH